MKFQRKKENDTQTLPEALTELRSSGYCSVLRRRRTFPASATSIAQRRASWPKRQLPLVLSGDILAAAATCRSPRRFSYLRGGSSSRVAESRAGYACLSSKLRFASNGSGSGSLEAEWTCECWY